MNQNGRHNMNCSSNANDTNNDKCKNKRNKRWLFVVPAVLLIVLAIGIAFFYFINISKNKRYDIDKDVENIVESYLDDEGYFEYDEDKLSEAGSKVYDYALKLKEKGKIKDASYCEEGFSVAFFLNDGTTRIYLPNIKNAYSGDGEYSVMFMNSFDDKTLEEVGADMLFASNPAKTISKKVDSINEVTYDKSVTIEQLKAIFGSLNENNTRAIFWKSHGGVYKINSTGETVFFFVTGEDENDDLYKEDRGAEKDDATENEPNAIVTTTNGKFAFTYKFVDEYMENVSGGLFISSACNSLCDGGNMAKTLIDKGFESYVGANGPVCIPYGNKVLGMVAEYISEKDSNGKYKNIGEAVTEAMEEIGNSDNTLLLLSEAVTSAKFIVINSEAFRLLKPEVCCNITSDDKSVDLNKVSIKVVNTDSTKIHEANSGRIEGKQLTEAGGKLNLYTENGDAISCELEISYEGSLVKIVPIEQKESEIKKMTIDLSVAKLDVVVNDRKGKFLEDAQVAIYGKVGESGTNGLMQEAILTKDESGNKVYRLLVEPGTYYISVKQGNCVIANRSEVVVHDSKSIEFIKNDTEQQIKVIVDNVNLWEVNFYGVPGASRCWLSDLDHNGLLEINSAETTGSGSFTTWNCYEVNENLDGLNKINVNVPEGLSFEPDEFASIGQDDNENYCGYYDEKLEVYYYVMLDYLRVGWTDNCSTYCLIHKNNTDIETELLGCITNSKSMDGTITTTTYLVDNNEYSSKEEFDAAMKNKVSGLKEFVYQVNLFYFKNSNMLYEELLEQIN